MIPVSSIRATNLNMSDEDRSTPVERSYLEVIYYLEGRNEPVIAAQLARWMHVRPPTVTNIVQRLEQKLLIQRSPSGAIALTPTGIVIAEQIVRRHRMLERYLYDVLKIPWHQVHREATMIEPAISPILEARIEAMLGDATTCPHGNPIPGQNAPVYDDTQLINIPPGAAFTLTRIDEEAGEDSCTLQLLWARGLLPGTPLVRMINPRDGVAIRRGERRIVLSRRVASLLWGTWTSSADTKTEE